MDELEAVASLLSQADDRDKNVRTRIAFELGRLRNPDARAAIEEAIHSDEWRRRFAAVRAIRDWAETDGARSATRLQSALKDPVPSVRWAAVQAVAPRDRIEALTQIALHDPAPTVRESALRALFHHQEAAATAAECLSDEDSRVRFAAVVFLREHGDERVGESLARALQDRFMWIRILAVRALARIGGKDAAPAIIPLLHDRKRWVRWEAANALGALGDSRAVEPLLDLLARSTAALGRDAAVVGLGRLRDRRAVEPIARTLHEAWTSEPDDGWNEDGEARRRFELRRDATNALLRIGGDLAADELRRLPEKWVMSVKGAKLF